MTQDQLGIALDILRPGARYRRYDSYEALLDTWEDEETQVPTEAELLTAWSGWLSTTAATVAAEAAQEAAGITALIDSLSDPNPNRPLNAAEVRFGLGLIVKQLSRTEPLQLSDQQAAALDAGIASLLAHLTA